MERGSALGGLLRQHRRAAGLTQEQLAERAEVSVRTVSDLERGVHARARQHTLGQLADALELAPDEREELFATCAVVGGGVPLIPLPPAFRLRTDNLFVGRAEARRRLDARFEDASHGHTQVVVVSGEAGIGKSTIARVSAQAWHEQGATVLLGHCEEHAADPYRPFLEALRQVDRSLPRRQMRSLAGPTAGLLALLVPDLRTDDGAVSTVSGDQLSVQEAVRAFLEALARDRPCVLILEDMRWADPASLALLRHVTRAGAGGLLILATARLDRAKDEQPLRSLFTELRHRGALEHLELGGLDPADVRSVLRAAAGVAPPELVEALHRETGGNPFFLHDLVGQLVRNDDVRDGRWRVHLQDVTPSEDVLFVVSEWIERVPALAQRILAIASVIGDQFDARTLAAVAEVEERDVIPALDDAVMSGLVQEKGAFGSWTFAHGIVRAGLYDRLTKTTRASLHARVAAFIEAQGEPSDDAIDRLAAHYHRALPIGGVATRAAYYAQRSAERATAMLAWEDAALGFEHALDALDHERAPETPRRCELLIALGNARTEALQRHLARPVFVEAAQAAMHADDRDCLVKAARGYAFMTKQGDADRLAIATWDAALMTLDPGDHAARATLLSALSTAHRLCGDDDRMRSTSVAALELARTAADTTALRVALANRSAALWDSPDVVARIALAEELIALARAESDIDTELDGLALLVLPLMSAGRVEEFDRAVEAATVLARANHRRISLAQTHQWGALRALMRGSYDDALQRADEALDISGAAPNFAMGHAALQHAAWRLGEANGTVDPALDVLAEQSPVLTVWRAVAAAAHCRVGEYDDARRLIDRATPIRTGGLEHGWSRVVTLALLAETASALQDRELCDAVHGLLVPYTGQLVVVASGTSCEGAVDRYLALLALTRDDTEGAVQLFEAGAALERAADAPALAARTQCERQGVAQAL